MSVVETRRHQLFPVLDMTQIETAKHFASGEARSFVPGEVVFNVGERSAPAWLVLEGGIEVVGRDGLDHEVAITTHGAGQISGELSQLTGRAALATGRAGAKGCTALPFDAAHLRALVVGSAELGETIMRAFILRRVGLNIAFAMQVGWYRAVHLKRPEARKLRLLLSSRQMLLRTRIDLDNHIRGVLKAFGLKVGKISTGQFEARVWELIDEGDAQIRWVVGTLLTTRAAVVSQLALLHHAVLAVVKQDQVCRRLMTVPGVGALTALAFTTAVDEPERFLSSAAVGAYFGLTPSKYASGETDYTGHITKCGDKAVRVLLCEAANALLTRVSRWSWLKRWGLEVLKRRGKVRAQVAVARRLAVIMHRMWLDGTDFRWQRGPDAPAGAAA